MASTVTARKAGSNGARPAFGVAPGKRRQRRVPATLAWAAAAAAGSLIGAALYLSSMVTTQVLAVGRPVKAGAVITAEDLTVASVRDDPALRPVPLANKNTVIGKVAVADLAAGSLLVEGQTGEARPLEPGESLVGVEVISAAAPAGWLRPGDRVQLVSTAKTGDGKGDGALIGEARVVAVAGARTSTGAIAFTAAVPAAIAPAVTAASAGQRVGVVLLPRTER